MSKRELLLEHLSNELRCNFLSDLSSPVYHLKEKKYFEWAPMRDFSLEDWQYVYRYITGEMSTATTIEEIRAEFIRDL